MPDINNDNALTEVTKYNNIITGNQVWLYKVNNGLHEWFDVDPWGDNDFWASEDIWSFFAQVSGNQTSLNETSETSNKRLIKTINILGQETQSISNMLLFNVYDDGTVEKRIIIE